MPDLGNYATEVLSAYAVTFVLLAALIGLSWRRYTKIRAALRKAERNG